MMRSKKKGLDGSIWASRGKTSNYFHSSASSQPPRPSQPTTSTIVPATLQASSPVNSGSSSPIKSNGVANNTAPPNPAAAADCAKTGLSSQQEFKRYIQIVRRLKWKLPYLSHGYHHAIAKPGNPMWVGETDAEEAELMFKLDFYEYYMLLERALVHLLCVFGTTVPKTGPVNGGQQRFATAAQRAGGTNGRGAAWSNHTFHENVINVLEKEDNPLHEALGTGEVLFCLYRAKELRNRWKYAEEVAAGKRPKGRERDGTAPLESYDLDRIFRYVFAGFDAGYAVAEKKVAEDTGVPVDGGIDVEGMDLEEDEFDFMVEAMDWEAV